MGEKHAPKVKDIRHLNSKKGKSYSSFGTTSIIRTVTWWDEVKADTKSPTKDILHVERRSKFVKGNRMRG